MKDSRRVIAENGAEAIVVLGAIPTLPIARTVRVPYRRSTPPSNVLGLYYLLTAAAEAGIKLVVQTNSVVTIKGGATTYRYLPLDDAHPGCVSDS